MKKITWLQLTNVGTPAFGSTLRLKVPGGWKVCSKPGPSTATDKRETFVPDPTGAWTSTTLQWEVVPETLVKLGTTYRARITGGWLVGNQIGITTSSRTFEFLADDGTWLQEDTPPSIATVPDASVAVGGTVSITPVVSNPSNLALSFTLVGVLPNGCVFNTNTGEIAGVVSTAGVSSGLKIQVLSSSGVAETPAFSITVVVAAVVAKSNLGFNLMELTDYGTQFAFNNLVKSGRTWTHLNSNGSANSTPLTVDANGYPTSLTSGTMARMYWAAQGATFPNNTTPTTETHSGSGTMVKGAQTPSLMYWDLTATTPGNHLNDLKIYIPGTSAADGTFYKPFVDGLRGFGILRVMDTNAINGNRIVNWADRTPVDHYTYSDGSDGSSKNAAGQANTVPYELQVELANSVGADLWMCVPAAANDDFITQLATLIKNTLNPNLKCYWEISNEVWLASFYGNQYFAQLGAAQGYGTSFSAIMKAQSRRSVEMFDLVDAVYGSEAPARRKRVIAGQTGNIGVASQLLDFQNAYQKTDFYAVGSYLTVNVPSGSSAATILAKAYDPADGYAKCVVDIQNSRNTCETRGVPLAIYEFGPGFANTINSPSSAGYNAASVDPAMETLAKTFIQKVWVEAAGGCPACWYGYVYPSSSGFNWGAASHINNLDTPKMRALKSFLN